MNKELIRNTINHILDNRNNWDQGDWYQVKPDCGTCCCFAGWVVELSGKDTKSLRSQSSVGRTARELLQINRSDADYLFDADRTLTELYDKCRELLDLEPLQMPKL